MRRFIGFCIVLLLLAGFIGCTPTSAQTPTLAPFQEPQTAPTRPVVPFSSEPTPNQPPTPSVPSSTTSAKANGRIEATISRVIDGDTIEVYIGSALFRVRYIGIDTPEQGKFGYVEATRVNAQLVGSNRTVQLERDVSETDQYGRLLRYVWVEEGMVNAILVASGYAQVSTYPPDVKYVEEFLELERQAREGGMGLWATSQVVPTSPSFVPSATINIKITRIFYDGLVPSVESDEYVEITNLGSEAVDLKGWVLQDISEGRPSFTFPSYVLQSGKSIRVYTNEIHPEYGGFSFRSGGAVWNNKNPDTAALFNAQGQEVSRKSY